MWKASGAKNEEYQLRARLKTVTASPIGELVTQEAKTGAEVAPAFATVQNATLIVLVGA